jgi:hypothetical protein
VDVLSKVEFLYYVIKMNIKMVQWKNIDFQVSLAWINSNVEQMEYNGAIELKSLI